MRFGFKSSVISLSLLSMLMADVAMAAPRRPPLLPGQGNGDGGNDRGDRGGRGGGDQGRGGFGGGMGGGFGDGGQQDRGGGRPGPQRPQIPQIPQRPEPQRPQPQIPQRPEPQRPQPQRPQIPQIPQRPEPQRPQPQIPQRPEPQRPQPPRPQIPQIPQRPEPQRPQPQIPQRPEPQRPQPQIPQPGRPGGHDANRDELLRRRRDDVLRQRQVRQGEIDRRRHDVFGRRDDFRRRFSFTIRRDVTVIRNPVRWSTNYNVWWTNGLRRPTIYRPAHVINWYVPMPEIGFWQYSQLDLVSDNIEYLTRDVYSTMASASLSTPNREYAMRLMNVLGQLVDAAENYNDAVTGSYDWSDSLYDLFYLESSLSLAETTLDGYSQEYRVIEEIRSLRFYVDELMWTYRTNY